MNDWAKLGFQLAILLVIAFIGYYVRRTAQDLIRLEGKQDKHEEKDDLRFDRLAAKIDSVKGNELLYEKLEAIRIDATDKRHALRAEMRDANASAYDRTEKLGEQLRAEIARLEGRLPKS